jgi:uncharacterized membrane protein YwaF
LGYAVLLGWAVLGAALSAALHAYTFAAAYHPLPLSRIVLLASAMGLILMGLADRQRLRMAGYFAYDTFTALTGTLTPEAATRGSDRILFALYMAFHAITFTLVYSLRIASRQARERKAERAG